MSEESKIKFTVRVDSELMAAVKKAAAAASMDDGAWISEAIKEKKAREGQLLNQQDWIDEAIQEKLGPDYTPPPSRDIDIFINIGKGLMSLNEDVPLKELAADLEASISGNRISGVYDDFPFECEYKAAGDKTPSSMNIILRHEFPEKIIFTKETKYDVISKDIGLACEVQSGDAEFDKNVYIDCEHPEFAKAFVDVKENRHLIECLFAISDDIKSIELAPSNMHVEISPCCADSSMLTSNAVESVLALLMRLSQNMPARLPAIDPFAASDTRIYTLVRVVLYTVALILIGLGVALIEIGLFHMQPVSDGEYKLLFISLRYSLPAMALFYYISYQLMKGRSSSGRKALMLILIAIPGFIYSGWGSCLVLNAYLDNSKVSTRILPVIGATHSSGYSFRHHIIVPSRRHDMEGDSIDVTDDFYNNLKNNEMVELKTRRGYWNVEWRVSVRETPGMMN